MLQAQECFNPRSREGSDTKKVISDKSRPSFNPRSREGSDLVSFRIFLHNAMFQSTLPRGERLGQLCKTTGRKEFQSTLPRGERLSAEIRNLRNTAVSIHAPARGATHCGSKVGNQDTGFNPRSREGSDKI